MSEKTWTHEDRPQLNRMGIPPVDGPWMDEPDDPMSNLPPSPDADDVERAARAIWEADNPAFDAVFTTAEITDVWQRGSVHQQGKRYRLLARAALAAARPATDAEQKVARVEALAKELEQDASSDRLMHSSARVVRKVTAARIRVALSGAHTEPKEQG